MDFTVREGVKMIQARMRLFMPCTPVMQLSKAAGHTVTVMRCVPSTDGGGQSLMRVESDEPDSEALRKRLESFSAGGAFKITTVAPRKHIVTAKHRSCEACKALAETHCFLDEGHSEEDGQMIWSVIAPNQDELKRLKELLEKSGTKVSFDSIHPLRMNSELTVQQEKVIRLAFELGYYNVPKDIDLGKLAKILEVSKPTLDIMLRRAQKKVLSSYLHSRS